MLLMVFGGSLGLVLGALGGSFGAFAGSRWHPEFSKLLFGAPLSPHLGPRGASNSPKRLPRRPHGEADGPTKPPRLIWRRSWTYFLVIWDPKSMEKKKARDIVTALSKRFSALEVFLVLLLLRLLLLLLRLLLLLSLIHI